MRNRLDALLYLLCFPFLWVTYLFLLIVSLSDFAVLYSMVRHDSYKDGRVSGVLMENLIRSRDLIKFYMLGFMGVGVLLSLAQLVTGNPLIKRWI